MQFDTAVAAHNAFKRAQQNGELGKDWDLAMKAEESFSSSAGEESTTAYQTLLKIGEEHPEATAFQEFLIYITWNHVMEHPAPARFRKGVELCNRYLKRTKKDETQIKQIHELRKSFLNGLGLGSSDEEEYEEDTFKGGD